MKHDTETVEVTIQFLTDLLNIRREHFKVCETFAIPVEKRGEAWVGDGINERIRTYLTAYNIKKSIVERENGAAFRDKLAPAISDPVLETQVNDETT